MDYSKLDEDLRRLGFRNDIESGIICRYKVQGIIVDIMPTNSAVLGFSNCWYSEGFKNAIDIELDSNTVVKIFSPAYFIASKLEAFKDRGGKDFRTSSDFEDIVYVFENCKDLEPDVLKSTDNLKGYFKTEFSKLLNNPNLEEGIYAHLPPRFATIKSLEIMALMRNFSS
jgi:hypothetical protein